MISERQLKRYCCGDGKDIENYDAAIADTTRKWVIHHRLELTEDGEFQYSMEDLRELGLYNKRPPEELILLTEYEHKKLHGKGRSAATREKSNKAISKALTGRKLTSEHCENLSKARKGRIITDEWRENLSKNCGKSHKGKTWKLINGKRVWLSKEIEK